MSASTSIIILFLVTSVAAIITSADTVAANTVAAGSKSDVNAYFKLLKDMKDHPSAAKGAKLMWDVIRAFKSYLCSVGSEECKAVKEYLEEYNLEKDENSAQELKNGLIADADIIFERTHSSFMKLDAIRIALTAVICDNEPKNCEFWKSYQKDAENWEDTIKQGPHPATPKEDLD